MTIAAAIPCKDGLVLCADTEETITDDQKRKASKIQVVVHMSEAKKSVQATAKITDTLREEAWSWRGDWVVGIAGAGHSDWIEAFIQGMSESVLRKFHVRRMRLEKLRMLSTEYAKDYFEKYIKNYAEDPSRRPQAHMLIAAQSKTNNAIFRIDDNLVLYDEWNQRCVAVGKGAPNFQYLANRLIEYGTMKQAASAAVYILHRVKSEVPGCGGNSHVVMIGRNGSIQTLSARRIMQLELHQAELETKLYRKFSEELLKDIP